MPAQCPHCRGLQPPDLYLVGRAGRLYGLIEEIREQCGDIKICSLSPKVQQVFDMLGFQELYDICDDLPCAVQNFAKASVKEG